MTKFGEIIGLESFKPKGLDYIYSSEMPDNPKIGDTRTNFEVIKGFSPSKVYSIIGEK